MRLLSDLIQVCDQLGVRQLIAVMAGPRTITLRLIYMLKTDLIRSGFYHQQAIKHGYSISRQVQTAATRDRRGR